MSYRGLRNTADDRIEAGTITLAGQDTDTLERSHDPSPETEKLVNEITPILVHPVTLKIKKFLP